MLTVLARCCFAHAAACNCTTVLLALLLLASASLALLSTKTLLTLLQSHVSELTRGLAATALAFHPDQPLLALVSWRMLARG